MGFFKEFFSELEKPAFAIHWETNIDDESELEKENKGLRQQLNFMKASQIGTKKVNAIDTNFRLLE